MGTVYLETAYYGDERTTRSVVDILRNKIIGSSLNVDVNDKITPPFTITPKTSLSPKEEKSIRAQAEKVCGGVDQACIESTEARLRQEQLAQKQADSNKEEAAIKGKRLTVTVLETDATGKKKRRRIVVPEGQTFKIDNLSYGDPKKPMDIFDLDRIKSQMILIGSIALMTAVWAFSIFATYTVFAPVAGLFAIPLTIVAFLVPYSGFAMIFIFFMLRAGIKTYVGD